MFERLKAAKNFRSGTMTLRQVRLRAVFLFPLDGSRPWRACAFRGWGLHAAAAPSSRKELLQRLLFTAVYPRLPLFACCPRCAVLVH